YGCSELLKDSVGDPVMNVPWFHLTSPLRWKTHQERNQPSYLQVCEWKEPEELQQILDLDLKDCGEPQEKLLKRCRNVIRYSVKTCHPRFFNQLFSGLDHHALAGRLITEMLNTSQYTYEIAPVFVLMEEVVLKKLRELIGWKKGDGIFCPGGSISNMYAMNVARFHCFPDCKQKGNWAIPKLAAFTSQEVFILCLQFPSCFLRWELFSSRRSRVFQDGRLLVLAVRRHCEAISPPSTPPLMFFF
uniref:Cysteine sulfinic acid decarboxylase n=1 Tax=Varanus komodoensis TaxID=61221 RepID=A0A8D2J1L6_VARKO